MYSKCFNNILQDNKLNQMEENKESKVEMISNDVEENETYPLEINDIPASFRTKHERILYKAYEDDQKCLKELKEMLQGDEESKAVEFEDDFLNVYLIANNYNMNEAFRMVLNYLDIRKKQSYSYKRIEVNFTAIPPGQFLTLLPHRHPDGSPIVLLELGKWIPAELNFEDFKSIVRLLFYQELRNPVTQITGFRIIMDFNNTGYQHLLYGTPMNMYLLYHSAFECLPGKYTEVHFVNTNYVLSTLLACFKPFLSESIKKTLYFHSAVEELWESFPRSTLPMMYGGSLRDYYMADYLKKANEDQGDFPPGGLKNFF